MVKRSASKLFTCQVTLPLCDIHCNTGCSSKSAARWVVAVVVVVGLRLLAEHVDVRRRLAWPPQISSSSKGAAAEADEERSEQLSNKQPGTPRNSRQHRDHDAWRKLVGSNLVASAWDKLCNSIIQEVRAVPRTDRYRYKHGMAAVLLVIVPSLPCMHGRRRSTGTPQICKHQQVREQQQQGAAVNTTDASSMHVACCPAVHL
jgi:hypothetical protein